MEQVSEVTEVSKNFLGSCHIKKKTFYSSLGHSSIPVQYSSPVVQSTDSRQPLLILVFYKPHWLIMIYNYLEIFRV